MTSQPALSLMEITFSDTCQSQTKDCRFPYSPDLNFGLSSNTNKWRHYERI